MSKNYTVNHKKNIKKIVPNWCGLAHLALLESNRVWIEEVPPEIREQYVSDIIHS